ncbi:MAG: aspartyl protease family protein [Flavobacteriaceae bacterium]
MKIFINTYVVSLFFLFSSCLKAQSNFTFTSKKKTAKVDVNLVSNLMIIPVKVNGTELSFLLDTGVKETILFNVSKVDSLALNSAKVFNIKGANDVKVKALKSKHNVLEIGDKIKSYDHLVYVAFNQESNLSAYIGEEIHGILGYHFFKDFIVELAYDHQYIKVYEKGVFKNKWKRYKEVDMKLSKGKPYVKAKLQGDGLENFLLDSGMSDGLWVFKEDTASTNFFGYYDDYLGMTVSGEVYGKRSKVRELGFVGEVFNDVKISYPQMDMLPKELKNFSERAGSIGGDLLKRFTLVFDYSNSKVYMKPNKFINDPFYYNKSGIVIRQDGEAKAKNKNNKLIQSLKDNNFISFVDLNYLLTPEFVIDHVTEGSPAAIAGFLKGDVLLEVNDNKTYKYNLKTLNSFFYDEDDKKVKIKFQRGDQVFEKTFLLKSPLKKTAVVQN